MTEEVHQYPHRAEVLRLTYLLAHEPVNSRPNIRWWVLSAALVICVGVLGCTGGSEYPLVGRWILQREGVAATMPYKLEWEFTEDQIVVRIVRASGDSQQASRNRYTIDTTKTPKWITVTLNDDGHQEIRPGIFRLVGDELHLKQAIGGGTSSSELWN
jgi:uncharacterized protein (TIGR03067 family)